MQADLSLQCSHMKTGSFFYIIPLQTGNLGSTYNFSCYNTELQQDKNRLISEAFFFFFFFFKKHSLTLIFAGDSHEISSLAFTEKLEEKKSRMVSVTFLKQHNMVKKYYFFLLFNVFMFFFFFFFFFCCCFFVIPPTKGLNKYQSVVGFCFKLGFDIAFRLHVQWE